jgi:single-strand DNA-binding protein
VTLWKGIAETTINTCRPGDWISVKGRLQAHEYEGRDGMMRSAYDIIAEHVSILQ